ncbi:MAG: deoxyribose-phosphate aldolase [Lachnospiraceae bacterium]|jgi:deoxyribose-phosphate aldolase|nr:deoxyribose-phosphate aldolase [Lachnospiraceae bacterium]
MTQQEILSHVDHTQLKAFATWADIQKLCDEAIEYKTASVCVPPCYIKRIHDTYGDKINICTVVGFPLGYSTTPAKVAEVKQALADGVSEVDMVVNISDVKNGDFEAVEKEIKTLKEACGDKILKVIIETCYLTEDEKIAMCKAVTNAGADFIKTSTGFGTAGATMEDIKLFKQHIGPNVKMKAAGGVKTVSDMENFINEGCERIGTSSAINMLQNKEVTGY